MKYFDYSEVGSNNEYIIKMTDMPNLVGGGSGHVLQARLLGLSYAEYLRFCYHIGDGAVTIRGKNSLYPVAYWKKSENLYLMVKLLNNKMDLALAQVQARTRSEAAEVKQNDSMG